MVTINAQRILNATEVGNIEVLRENGMLEILIDQKQVLIVPAAPLPQIQTDANAVHVLSGDILAAVIQADSKEDAKSIASTLEGMLAFR